MKKQSRKRQNDDENSNQSMVKRKRIKNNNSNYEGSSEGLLFGKNRSYDENVDSAIDEALKLCDDINCEDPDEHVQPSEQSCVNDNCGEEKASNCGDEKDNCEDGSENCGDEMERTSCGEKTENCGADICRDGENSPEKTLKALLNNQSGAREHATIINCGDDTMGICCEVETEICGDKVCRYDSGGDEQTSGQSV